MTRWLIEGWNSLTEAVVRTVPGRCALVLSVCLAVSPRGSGGVPRDDLSITGFEVDAANQTVGFEATWADGVAGVVGQPGLRVLLSTNL